MKQAISPNFDERVGNAAVTYIVLHYTGMPTAQEALDRLCDPSAQVSAHYLIDEDGSLCQMVDEARRAWHAGQSFWRGASDLNSLSIGIELVNKGHAFGYTPFPSRQIERLTTLLKDIMKRYALPPTALLGHSDIAPMRKEDPGELFPWQALATEGLGLWPAPMDQDRRPITETETITGLAAIGYDTRSAEVAFASGRAFLRRFHPERLARGFDDESAARLRAMARLVSTP